MRLKNKTVFLTNKPYNYSIPLWGRVIIFLLMLPKNWTAFGWFIWKYFPCCLSD